MRGRTTWLLIDHLALGTTPEESGKVRNDVPLSESTMRINDQLAISFTLIFTLACETMPDDPGRSESTSSSTFAVETDSASETGAPTTGLDASSSSSVETTGCPPDECPADTSGSGSSDGSTTNVCFAGSKPKPGELYGPCKGQKHECDEGLICQVADDPDPQFPKGTICLTTCWGEGNDGTCPEALDSCGEPFAKSACQSATDPLRPVPCELPCASDNDCPTGALCFLDRCVWEGL